MKVQEIVETDENLSREEWRKQKRYKRAMFTEMQNYSYPVKVRRAEQRATEFYMEMQKRGFEAHVSVGGLDSITLYLFLRSIGIHVPAISVSGVEDLSVQRVHKALNIIRLQSYKSKVEVLNEIGFPVISKRIAGKIDLLQHPTEDNKIVRHAIITGECGAQGHFAKNSRMQLPKKWLQLFAGMENEQYGTHYQEAPFRVSNKCCYYLKEKPCDDWAREHKSYPYLGMMASEGGQREEALVEHGCNYYGKTVMRSAPFAIFLRQDILTLALEMDKWYKDHIYLFEEEWNELHKDDKDFKPYEPLDTIIPAIYGTIEKRPNGELYTTKAQRTGCSMCGFGIHLEKRPHRFDRLREQNPKEWEFWMYKCCKDKKTGEVYGWGKVLDYIGVGWEDIPATQIDMFEYLGLLGE